MNCLMQLQLSTYSKDGRFDLSCDSNFNIAIGRINAILKHCPDWKFYIIVPTWVQSKRMSLSLFSHPNVIHIPIDIYPNAIVTRYDFAYANIENTLKKFITNKIDIVFVNDPMLLKNYKTLFNLSFGYNPKFICNSHFIDNPSNRKVNEEVSYWYSQISAAVAADLNIYQCQAAMDIFHKELESDFKFDFIESLKSKSTAWNDGFSYDEVSQDLRDEIIDKIPRDKIIVFFPNRISLYKDYTNSMRFIECANSVFASRQDFMCVFGNPGQKLSNDEICKMCKPAIKLVNGTLSRNQYITLLKYVDINVGLYLDDSYGGCAFDECVSQGSLPLSPNVNRYKYFFDKCLYKFKVSQDFSDLEYVMHDLLDYCKCIIRSDRDTWGLRKLVIDTSSYESQAQMMINDIERVVCGVCSAA